MESFKCPQCGSKMEIVIGVTNPTMAVAAEALPRGVIMRCTSCYHFSADFSNIPCPQCGKKTLETTMDKVRAFSPDEVLNGELKCKSCKWSKKVSSNPESVKLDSDSVLDEFESDLEEMDSELEDLESYL